ncbi:MAG: 50S ribosomal protein L25 [Verrucomicrobia bacterium]|nr:50S ribosomal protein L25 [Verrucomicrobiota bacterium]
MADQIVMEAEKRVPGKSAVARNLRRAGILPANLNRVGGASESIQFNLHAFERMLQRHASESMIVDLLIEGKACKALLREIQHDPVHGKVLHVDLQEVSMTKTVRVPVQIILVGEAKGVKMGGDQDHLLRELEVDCLVSDMTESVEVDVSHLAIGERIRVEELQVDPKLRVVTPGDVVVVSVNAPRVEEEPGAAEAAGEGAEPAVVGDAGSDQKESDGSPASGES